MISLYSSRTGGIVLANIVLVSAVGVVLFAAARSRAAPAVLGTELLKAYVERFNKNDEELYANIPNAKALAFLEENIPLLACPDEDIQRIYYFRWWTYRKHVKLTPDGYVVTEFLPKVPWSAKHNTISCPAGHHFYEGRWLRNPKYLDDYAVFWFRKGGSPRRYSFWAADAMYARYLVSPNRELITGLLDDLVGNYRAWERSRLVSDGMFWQIDDRDGMEVSIGHSGKRATINSYMYGGARAIATIAVMAGRAELAKEYTAKAERIRQLVHDKLWDPEAKFFKTLPRSDAERTFPRHSGDGSVPRLHWWDPALRGKTVWLQYDLPAGARVEAAEVYWHSDGSGIRLPKSWRILVGEGEKWEPVEATSEYPVKADTYNRVTFKPVQTTALRLEVESVKGGCAGAYEWRVLAGGKNIAPMAKISMSFPEPKGRRRNSQRTLNDGEGKSRQATRVDIRELHGFTPWYFNLPEPGKGYEVAWKQLMDPKGFYAPFGPTTAEQRHPGFKISYEGHGCQWNGPSWPFSTSVTLTALANVLNNYEQDAVTKADYFKTLKIYTGSHRFRRPDGKIVNWIDENLNPFTGDWIARTRCEQRNAELKAQGKEDRILRERGKDYNHSSYCDLVITGLIGLRPRADDVVEVNPLVPAGRWDWFCLDRVLYHGRILTIVWDKTGEKYGKGKGLRVFADGAEIAHADSIERVSGKLPAGPGK